MSIKESSQYVLNLEQQAALGCAVVEASFLERYIETLIQRFCDIPTELHDALISETTTIGPKIRILTELVKPLLNSKRVRDEFESIMDNIGRTNTNRTIAVHGIWTAKSENALRDLLYGSPAPRAIKGRQTAKQRELTAQQLLRLAEEINAANWALHHFVDAHFPGLVLLPRLSPK